MNLNKGQRKDREFQRGMETDERRHTRQNERLQLIKKEREQRKANKRRTFGRYTQNKDNKNTRISYHVRGIAVKIIDNVNDCEKYINQLLSNNPKLLGFDCEWKPIQNKQEYNRISLLQLCDNNICLLLKMIDIEKSGNFPINLVQLLKNANIIKVGLSISGDKEKLYGDYKIDVNGCVDIKQFILGGKCSFMETNDKERMSIKYSNLENICNYMFGYNAFVKNKEITMSNWELNPLTKSQIMYAASDVIYGYYAFLQCIVNISNSKLNYSLISNDENSKIISFAGAIANNIDIVQLCDGIIDTKDTYTNTSRQPRQKSKKMKKEKQCDKNYDSEVKYLQQEIDKMEEEISYISTNFINFDFYHETFESDEQFLEMISNLTFSNETKNSKCVNQCINELVQDRINVLKDEIEYVAKHRIMTRLENFQLEIEIINIDHEILSMQEKIRKCKHDNFSVAMDKYSGTYVGMMQLQNLIRRELEYCFCDKILLRENHASSSLMRDMCDEKNWNDEVNKFGFVSLDRVMKLKCINLLRKKQIPERHVVGALRSSKFLTITKQYDSDRGPCHSSRLVGRTGSQQLTFQNVEQ